MAGGGEGSGKEKELMIRGGKGGAASYLVSQTVLPNTATLFASRQDIRKKSEGMGRKGETFSRRLLSRLEELVAATQAPMMEGEVVKGDKEK